MPYSDPEDRRLNHRAYMATITDEQRERYRQQRNARARARRREARESPMPKIYLHERASEYRCQAGLAESDTKAPHEVRHECDRLDEHDGPHVCSCGLELDVA